MEHEKRYEQIIDNLRQNGRATLRSLADLCEVSVDTVRRDLKTLEGRGAVRMVRGGAVISDEDPRQKSYGIRSVFHHDEKKELCANLGQIVREGMTLALNNGTTNSEAARYLCDSYDKLTVITNSLEVISILLDKSRFNVIIPGGFLDMQEKSIYGQRCEKDICDYNIDLALLAVNAVSLSKGITDFRFNEIGIIKAMLRSSRASYVLADSSKFESVSCVNVSPLNGISGFLTDELLPEETKRKYESAGYRIFVS